MCGRYAFYQNWNEFLETYDIEAPHVEDWSPVFNAAPTMNLPVVFHSGGRRVADTFRWGLIPHWSTDEKIGYKMINARAETIADKPAFRKPFASQRCLVPASGFFEWRKEGKQKQSYFIRFEDESPMLFAGLYDEWTSKEDGEVVTTFTIITTEVNTHIAELHDRMPAIVPQKHVDDWLGQEMRDKDYLQSLLKPWQDNTITFYPVSQSVSSPRNQGPELVTPIKRNLFDL